ncbi:TonB-dependent receptor [Rhizorhabdus phycosphaerae]|uniref:TonB-dependent receptor n=1 Tax=Rhizorhabdus phycosphaerae TaxID=2711156 RepID=UPI0013EB15A7|nr:TonB-dependent receptor [Rhizorhabdus phycosphaerae]
MKGRYSARARLLSGALLIAVVAGPAVAQGAGEEGGIQDIVVTARKRVETTQDVPVAVTALTREQLSRYDLSSLERVAASTPQFVIGRAPSGSGATLVLRGIGSNTTSIGLEQSVAVVVDGIYYGQGRTINEGFFDLGRLEILKGPQALFFGKNATAGVVSITTADPGDRPEFSAKLGYEFAGQQILGEAVASGPLTETLGARVAVRASKMYDGYFRNIGTAQTYPTRDRSSLAQVVNPTNHVSDPAGDGRAEEFYIRTTLKWTPTDRLTATLKANFGTNDNDNPGANNVFYYCPTGTAAFNPNVRCGRRFVSSSNRIPAAIAASIPYGSDGSMGNEYRSWAVTANLNYEMDDVTITSATNYNWNRNIFRFDGDLISSSGPQNVFATEWSTFRAFSSELRALTTYEGPINLMVGGYYQKTKRDYLAWTASGGLENSAAVPDFRRYLANSKDSETNGETIALFGQVTYKPVERVEISGGVRYTHETKDSYFEQPYAHPIRVAQGIFLPNVRIFADQTFNDWSPEATISFKATRDVNLYFGYKTAYKSGGFSNSGILSATASVDDFTFDAEKARGFEGGVKTTLLDRQLRLNIALYRYRISNLQIDFFNAPVFAFSTINAGSATTKGVELEFEYGPRTLPGFNLRGSLNYNKARYGDVPNAPCYGGMTIADGCTIPAPGQRPRQNLRGKPTANAPLWTASLGASYDAALTDRLRLGLSLDARYSDNYIATAFGNPFTRQNSYVNIDGSIRLHTDDDRWELALIGKNLTNRWYAVGGVDAPNTGGGTGTATGVIADQAGYASLPRTVQVQLSWRY